MNNKLLKNKMFNERQVDLLYIYIYKKKKLATNSNRSILIWFDFLKRKTSKTC